MTVRRSYFRFPAMVLPSLDTHLNLLI